MAKHTVIKATGMIPVEVIDDSKLMSVKKGDVFGVTALKFDELKPLGAVTKVSIPDGVETEEVETYIEKADGQEFKMVRPIAKVAAAAKNK
jgi:hypothetical protein